MMTCWSPSLTCKPLHHFGYSECTFAPSRHTLTLCYLRFRLWLWIVAQHRQRERKPYLKRAGQGRSELDPVPVTIGREYVRGNPGSSLPDAQTFVGSVPPTAAAARPASSHSVEYTLKASAEAASSIAAMEAMIKQLSFQDAPAVPLGDTRKSTASFAAPMTEFLSEMDRTLRNFV